MLDRQQHDRHDHRQHSLAEPYSMKKLPFPQIPGIHFIEILVPVWLHIVGYWPAVVHIAGIGYCQGL